MAKNMRVSTLLIVSWILLLLAPVPVRSQVNEEGNVRTAPARETRSPVAAGFLEGIVPTAGYAYGGHWSRGLLPNAVRVGGLVLAVAHFDLALFGGTSECPTGCQAGLVIALAGSVWAIAGAVDTVNDFNDRFIAASSRVLLLPSPEGQLEIGMRFRW
jgi:hypothetical protein